MIVASQRLRRPLSALAVLSVLAGGAACQERSSPAGATKIERVTRPASAASALRCEELRPLPAEPESLIPEKVGLRPLTPGTTVVISKLGVVITFNRDEFLQAARCLHFDKAVSYVERETGFSDALPIMDAFQTSYVAAALLDVGRADVRRHEEPESRKWIARDPWAANGCNGHCRSAGRLYRLSAEDADFFLRITDRTTEE